MELFPMQNKALQPFPCFSSLTAGSFLLSEFLLIISIDTTIICFLCEYLKASDFQLQAHHSFPSSPIHFSKVKVLSREVYLLGKHIMGYTQLNCLPLVSKDFSLEQQTSSSIAGYLAKVQG